MKYRLLLWSLALLLILKGYSYSKANHKQIIKNKIVFAVGMTRLLSFKESENKWEIAESDQKYNAIFKWKICQDT